MPSFGNLFASLTLESATFMSGIKAAQKELKATQKTFATVGRQMQGIGAIMTVGITAPFTALVTAAIPAAVESQQAIAQVNASLKSMGPVAGRTSEQLSTLAGHLQDVSLFDDDDILKSVTANLLTFGRIHGAVFDQAQQVIVDYSAKTGRDLQGATIMVAKALQDPVKGVTALGKAGVVLDQAQKDSIKSMVEQGNVAGAQAIILGELQKEYGGAAQAQRNATPTAAMDQAWRTFQENVGGAALKVLPSVTNALTGLLNAFNQLSPAMQTFAIGGAAVAAIAGPILAGLGTIVTAVGGLLPLLVKLPAALALVRTAIMTQALPAIISFGITLAPILLPLAAVAGAIALVVAVVRNWDKIKPYVDKVVGWMGALYTGVKTWVVDKLGAVWATVTKGVEVVRKVFFALYDAVVGHSYIPDMVDEIGQHMALLDTNMVGQARKATAATADTFAKLQQELKPILERLFPEQAKYNTFQTELETLRKGMERAGFTAAETQAAIEKLRAEYLTSSTGSSGTVSIEAPDIVPAFSVADQVLKDFEDRGKKTAAVNDNLRASFADMARDVIGSLGNLASNIKSGDWLGALQSVLDVVSQISGILKGTGSAATRTFSTNFGGARAAGGPVLAGRDYLVGERGPEIVRMGGSGMVIPNGGLAGRPSVVQLVVEEGSLFRPTVRSVAGDVSIQTVSASNGARDRLQRRTLVR